MPFVLEKVEVDEDGKRIYAPREAIPVDEILLAEVVDCEKRITPFDIDDTDPKKGKKTEVSFRFRVVDDRYPQWLGRTMFGNTPAIFNTHENCKLRMWVEEIYGQTLEEGFVFNEPDVIGQQVRVIVGNRPGKDKNTGEPMVRDFVASLLRAGAYEETSYDAF